MPALTARPQAGERVHLCHVGHGQRGWGCGLRNQQLKLRVIIRPRECVSGSQVLSNVLHYLCVSAAGPSLGTWLRGPVPAVAQGTGEGQDGGQAPRSFLSYSSDAPHHLAAGACRLLS